MEPIYRDGTVVIVQPGAAVRKGDRVVARTKGGEVLAKLLGRRTETTVELVSLNPAYPARTLKADEVDWIARIVWASQ
jgi:phage repressor protein C with HTH and peptisase S24 domain